MNLAIKSVLGAVTKIEYATLNTVNYTPLPKSTDNHSCASVNIDTIAQLCTLIQKVFYLLPIYSFIFTDFVI